MDFIIAVPRTEVKGRARALNSLRSRRRRWYALSVKIEKLSNTLRKVLANRGMSRGLGLYRVAARWEEAVGAVIAGHARPAFLKSGKLSVLVDSPVWMQQLSLMKPGLIEEVNRHLGEETVKDIVLTLGEVARAARGKDERVEFPQLTAEERESALRPLSLVSDPDIRAALGSLIEKDMRSKKRKKH